MLEGQQYPPDTIGYEAMHKQIEHVLHIAASTGLDPAKWKEWSKSEYDLDRVLDALKEARLESEVDDL